MRVIIESDYQKMSQWAASGLQTTLSRESMRSTQHQTRSLYWVFPQVHRQ